MRIPRVTQNGEVGFNMTPMIDVVFQLIIFFLLSSHLAKQENQLELPLPSAGMGEEDTDDERPRVTINILASGQLQLGSQPITPDELTAHLRERLARLGKDLELRIRSDREAPYRFVDPVLLASARAGLWNVTFAVYRRGEEP